MKSYSFTPIQPIPIKEDDTLRYSEISPQQALAPYIHCYWQMYTLKPLEAPFCYRVVSDACIDILWEQKTMTNPYVAGFNNTFTMYNLDSDFHYMGVRFLPTAFPLLFRIPANEISVFEELNMLVPQFSNQLSQRIGSHPTLTSLKNDLDSLFLSIVHRQSKSIDGRLLLAIDQIIQRKGHLSVETDLSIGLSPRQLRRLFQFYVGQSPKNFCKVVRFQCLLSDYPTIQSLKTSKSFFDYGYYDQAHFVKEFKQLYGLTPTQAFE